SDLVGEAVAPRPAGDGHVLEPVQALLRPHPEASLAVLEERDHVVVGQAPLSAARFEPAAGPADDPLAERPHPEVLVAVLPDRARLVPRKALRPREPRRSSVLEARDPAPRPPP